MKNLFPTLQTCEKLKELGFSQNNIAAKWLQLIDNICKTTIDYHYHSSMVKRYICVAPTFQEIVDEIIKDFGNDKLSLFFKHLQDLSALGFINVYAEHAAHEWIKLKLEQEEKNKLLAITKAYSKDNPAIGKLEVYRDYVGGKGQQCHIKMYLGDSKQHTLGIGDTFEEALQHIARQVESINTKL